MNETNTTTANDSDDKAVTRRMSTTDVTTVATAAFKNLIGKSTNKRMSVVDANPIAIEASNITPKPMPRRMSLLNLSTAVIAANSFNSKLLSRRSSIVDSNTTARTLNNFTPTLTIRRGSIVDSNSISTGASKTVRKPGNKLISAVYTNAAAVAFNNLIGKRINIPISPSIVLTTKNTRSIINGQDETSRKKDRIIQNFLLIWLDTDINEKHDDYQNIVKSLERIVNAIIIFTDTERCIEYLTQITDEKIFIIISDTIEQSFVSRIHHMSQLNSIYIFCKDDTSEHQQWPWKWFKVKNISTDILLICNLLQKATRQCDQDMISLSFVSANVYTLDTNSDQIDPSFLYTQLLKEILVKTDDVHPESVKELAAYCHTFYVNNHGELKNIAKFAHEYRLHRPLWWYKHRHFLYSMLNRALRNLEMKTIFRMRFFIRDIHQDIEHTHLEQSNKHTERFVTIYRGQILSKRNLEKVISMKGGLISFNNFFFASQNQEMCMNIVRQVIKDPQSIGILFIITLDTSVPFAIDSYSEFEHEILLSISSVFRIGDIKQIDDNVQIWEVKLTLVTNDDSQLRSIRKIVESKTNWYRLSQLLMEVGEFDKSEEVYLAIINQTSDDNKKADLYQQVGLMKKQRGDYIQVISFYEKALVIRQRILPSNHPNLMFSFKEIGEIYKSISKYSKAVWYYEKAFEIEQENRPVNHSLLAVICDSIAFLYSQLGEHSKALSFYEKALDFRQNAIPLNLIDVAESFKNIGSFYNTSRDYSKALSFYEQALKIYEKNLPSYHPDLAILYTNIGTAYYNINKYSKMLTFYEKALEINQKLIPTNHSVLAASYRNTGSAYHHLGEYSKGLLYYNKSLEIHQRILSPKHPSLIELYHNIGSIYDNMNQYKKALEFYEKAFEIRKETLPSNHPQLAESFNNIGSVYYDLGEYVNALSFHERAVNIGQSTLPPTHPDLDLYLKSFKMTKKQLELLTRKQ